MLSIFCFCFFLFPVQGVCQLISSPGANPSVTSQLSKWASCKLTLISYWQMQLYCSRGVTFICDEPLYLTSKVSINQLASFSFVNIQHRTEQAAATHCLATPHRLLLLIHSSVRCQGLALMKIELQTHLHPRPKEMLNNALSYSQSRETNLWSEAGINKPNVWRIDRMRRGKVCVRCGERVDKERGKFGVKRESGGDCLY